MAYSALMVKFWLQPKRVNWIILVFCWILGICAEAQIPNYSIDPTFNSGLFYSKGVIRDVLLTDENEFFIGGSFMSVNQAQGYSFLSYNGNNLLWNPQSSGGPGDIKSYKNDYLVTLSGPIGLITFGQGTNTSFQFEYQKPAYSGFLGNDAFDTFIEPDDRILVVGRFFTDSVNTDTNSLRQLCRVDSTGAPDPDFPMLHCASPLDSKIFDIEQLSDGSYIVAGDFHELGSFDYNIVGRLNSDFSVDNTFINSFSEGDSGFILGVDSQDRTWLRFSQVWPIDDLSGESTVFTRILPTGEIDPNFNPPALFTYDSEGFWVRNWPSDFLELPDGRFIIVGAINEANGLPKRGIMMIEDDGTVIEEAFEDWGADEAVWGTFVRNPAVTVIRQLPDGKLLLGGRFSSFGGEPYSCLVRLQPNGFVGVDEKEGRGKLKIWPNPTSDNIRVALPNENERIERIEIADLQGRLVQVNSGYQASNSIDVSDLNAGVYLVRAWSEKGVYTQKLILE